MQGSNSDVQCTFKNFKKMKRRQNQGLWADYLLFFHNIFIANYIISITIWSTDFGTIYTEHIFEHVKI